MGAWEITLKDLRLLARDKRAAVILLLLPLIFIYVIGKSTGQIMDAREGGEKVTVGVVNLDSPQSSADDAVDRVPEGLAADLIAEIEGHPHFEVHPLSNEQAAEEALDRGRAIVLLIVGREFEERVDKLELSDILYPQSGRLADGPEAALDLQIVTKQSLAKVGTLAGAVIYGDAVRIVSQQVVDKAKRQEAQTIIERKMLQRAERKAEENRRETRAAIVKLAQQSKSPSSVVYETVVPSYTVLFVFFLINIMARSFIAERELGTLKRLFMAPISTASILVGKNLPFLLLSLLQTAMLFLCGRMIFQMSWGVEPWLLLPVIVSTSLAATSLGLLVSTLIRTDAQVSAYANSLVILLAAISGCFLPRHMLSESMRQVSLATPHAWALIAYDEILTHQTIDHEVVAKCCGMLLAFSALFFTLGWLRFRMRDE